jgi:hypothetical protein
MSSNPLEALVPTGGKIVSMIEYKGDIILATEHHVYLKTERDTFFKQLTFICLEETKNDR